MPQMSPAQEPREPRERQTRQRDALLHALQTSAQALTPAELCERAQQQVPTLNLSTVYRQINALLDSGEVLRVELPGQSARYEAACRHQHAHEAHHHHHHFHCTACDRVFAIHACPGAMDELAPPGCRVDRHDLTLHGLCADCHAAEAGAAGAVAVSAAASPAVAHSCAGGCAC